jgi:type I restriction enzyme S subunit
MNERRECKIKEIVLSANTGLDAIKRAPIVDRDTGIKCLRIQDVSQEKKYEDWGFTEVEQRNFHKFQLKKNDIIVARTGASIGVNKIIEDDMNSVLNNGLIRIRANESLCDPKFLFYNFRTSNYNAFIESISGGTSTQPNMQINALLSYEIVLPPLPVQKVIVELLSSLDNKIALLHRQNSTLEAIAETFFRQWFVVEAKEDWITGKLGDEFDFTMGQSPLGSSFNEDGVGVPMFQGNADFEYRFPKERVYTTDPTRFAQRFDTLISVRAPVGAQNMAHKKCCIGRGVAAFRYKANNDFYTYTYFKLRSLMEEIKKFNDEGTVFGSIGKSDFEALESLIAPLKLVVEFENKAKPINDKIINNCAQIRTLEKLRDTLLPKLMSGEVRVTI